MHCLATMSCLLCYLVRSCKHCKWFDQYLIFLLIHVDLNFWAQMWHVVFIGCLLWRRTRNRLRCSLSKNKNWLLSSYEPFNMQGISNFFCITRMSLWACRIFPEVETVVNMNVYLSANCLLFCYLSYFLLFSICDYNNIELSNLMELVRVFIYPMWKKV